MKYWWQEIIDRCELYSFGRVKNWNVNVNHLNVVMGALNWPMEF